MSTELDTEATVGLLFLVFVDTDKGRQGYIISLEVDPVNQSLKCVSLTISFTYDKLPVTKSLKDEKEAFLS